MHPATRFISNLEFALGYGPVFYRGKNSPKENVALKFGFSANLTFVRQFTRAFQLRSVFAYEIKGSKLVHHSIDPDYNPPAKTKNVQNISLHYATFTLLSRYSFTKSKKIFVGFGPYFGYLHRTKVTTDYYVNGSLFLGSGGWPDPQINNRLFDAGLAVAAGIDIRSERRRKANVQLIYKKGMVDINQPMIAPMRNNTISMLVGITLR